MIDQFTFNLNSDTAIAAAPIPINRAINLVTAERDLNIDFLSRL